MSKNKQEDILEAAMQLFAERGYDGTTIPMIADKAKVGAGTIYRYFDNKESLVNSLFVKCVTQFSDILNSEFPGNSGDVREQFSHIFYRMFQFAKHNPYALLFIDSHCMGYYLNEESNKVYDDFLAFIIGAIEKGQERGAIRQLPSNALIAIVYGAFIMLFKMEQAGALENTGQLLEELEESCWNAVRII
ncbi:TetR/AcrR family transcriptional regulator [Metasolibacillus meyeri]|uniref:TetR/AcrR family transcriptional regulator n=1 Tax=Metasolibacillus meyeri TaxID=1071052 RepID=A0AAW9NQM2_9BACL|nr:TetR/AcrR family transcriptional regulator [Metasolibacillus meyeri]MEC1177138.1 TetR/AcrR family transcriptional regulator [Metasolibacillus meyeri]